MSAHPLFCSILVAALGAGALPTNLAADMVSTFSADLTVNLTFPADIEDKLEITTPDPTDAFLPDATSMAIGDARVTQAVKPTSAFANDVLTFTAGPIAGSAGPGGGSAQAVSFGTSQTIMLENMTDGMFSIQLSGTYTYDLSATAAPGGFAGAAFSFQVDNNTNDITVPLLAPIQNAVVAPPNDSSVCNNCSIAAFKFDIPPGETDVNIDPFVSGEAFSTPEPSMLIPVFCVAAALFLLGKSARVTNN